MNNTIEYKGYVGSVEFSEKDELFFGKIQGIRSAILYEGVDAKSLINDFHASVDSYLEACENDGVKPEVAFKGSLNIRLDPELHKRAAIRALAYQQSLNSFIRDAVKEKLDKVV